MIRRALLAVAALSALAAPAWAGPKILGGGSTPVVTPGGSVAVGTVLSTPSYSGATYQWTRNGSAISAATSSTYTTVSADGGTTVTVRITLNGVTVTSTGNFGFFYPTGSNLITAAATLF